MAKHAKKRKKVTHRRRRRVSGIGGLDIQAIALAIGGAIAANKLSGFLAKDPTKTTMVNLSPYAGIVAGIGLAMFVKNPIVKALSAGMVTMGGFNALKKLAPGLVGNFAFVPTINSTSNRYRQLPRPSVNGVGFPLPRTSVYKDSMSVVNGIGNHNPNGSGGANPGY